MNEGAEIPALHNPLEVSPNSAFAKLKEAVDAMRKPVEGKNPVEVADNERYNALLDQAWRDLTILLVGYRWSMASLSEDQMRCLVKVFESSIVGENGTRGTAKIPEMSYTYHPDRIMALAAYLNAL